MFNPTYIPFINNLRGLAALSVCLFHFIYSTINYVKDETVLSIAYYGQYGVSLFFVISGIVIPLSLLRSNYTASNWYQFFAKRVIRIEPTYIVALILSLLLIVVRNYFSSGVKMQTSASQIALHFGYLIPFFKGYKWLNEVFWTLSIEFQYYLVISVLILLIIKARLIGRLLFYAIMLFTPFYFIDTNFFPAYSALFLVGSSWCFYYQKKIELLEFIFILLISCSVVWYKFSHTEAIVSFLTVISIQFFKTYSNKSLDFFGNISFSLYLIHPIIGASIINSLSHYFFQSWQKPIVILVGTTLTVLSAYVMYRYIEKPTQQLSKRIIY